VWPDRHHDSTPLMSPMSAWENCSDNVYQPNFFVPGIPVANLFGAGSAQANPRSQQEHHPTRPAPQPMLFGPPGASWNQGQSASPPQQVWTPGRSSISMPGMPPSPSGTWNDGAHGRGVCPSQQGGTENSGATDSVPAAAGGRPPCPVAIYVDLSCLKERGA
jgi:hypothetical protein